MLTDHTDTTATLVSSDLRQQPVYMDCAATSPIDPRVQAEVLRYLTEEFGNAGSRTHLYGEAAKKRVNRAREQVAAVVDAKPDEVVFTSGATESDNLALLGLATHAAAAGRRHLVSTMIEHKAVLEPLEALRKQGVEVTLVPAMSGGMVDPDAIAAALRPETLAVSVMAVNNETGVIQPIADIAERLADHDAYFHVDAAQGFGKILEPLRHKRIDLISISGHKLYAPKGVGALITRRRGFRRPPLQPLVYGGGQERGLRPGTLPVPLIAGVGTAAQLAIAEHDKRMEYCAGFKTRLLKAFAPLQPQLNGDPNHTVPYAVNLSLPGVDSEAAMLAVKDLVAISNGSACTSQSYDPSHVLEAMKLTEERIRGALRLSWCHLTPEPDWPPVIEQLARLQRGLRTA